MTVRRLRRAVAMGVLAVALAVSSAEAAPAAARFAAPDLWAQAWEWVASWWGAWSGEARPSGEKQGGTSESGGLPLTPTGTTSTTTPPPTGQGEVGGHIDPNGGPG